MNIGELFVNLGIKGGKETQNTLQGVKKGMVNVKSTSLEAKAAILAAVYAFKSLTQQSMNQGTALVQFSNLTGLSTKKLQQWQYANKLAGGTAEEVTGVVTSMQQAFAQLELGEGPAKYMGMFAEGLRNVGESLDVTKMKDSFYTLEKFRSFIKGGGTGNIGRDNEIGASLGITPNMIAGARGGAFSDKKLNSASIYSDSQAKSLQNVKAQWVELTDSIEKSFGRLNAKFGGKLTEDLKGVVKNLAAVAEKFILLANQAGAIERIGAALQNVAHALDLIKNAKEVFEMLIGSDQDSKDIEKQRASLDKAGLTESKSTEFLGGLKTLYGDILLAPIKDIFSNNGSPQGTAFAPDTNGLSKSTGGANVTIINNNGAGTSASEVAKGTANGLQKAGIKAAYNQIAK